MAIFLLCPLMAERAGDLSEASFIRTLLWLMRASPHDLIIPKGHSSKHHHIGDYVSTYKSRKETHIQPIAFCPCLLQSHILLACIAHSFHLMSPKSLNSFQYQLSSQSSKSHLNHLNQIWVKLKIWLILRQTVLQQQTCDIKQVICFQNIVVEQA